MVKNSGAKSTEYIDPEDVDNLCKKTINYGLNWAKRAESLWEENLEKKQHNKEKQNKKEKELIENKINNQ